MGKLESMAYLKTAANINEADIIESILNMEQIPVHREEVEGGNYLKNYHGYSMYGVDLYVPNEAIELAGEIMDFEGRNMNWNSYSGNQLEGQEDEFQSIRQKVGKIIVWTWIILSLSSLAAINVQMFWELLHF